MRQLSFVMARSAGGNENQDEHAETLMCELAIDGRRPGAQVCKGRRVCRAGRYPRRRDCRGRPGSVLAEPEPSRAKNAESSQEAAERHVQSSSPTRTMAPHPLLNKKAPAVTLKDASGNDYAIEPGTKGVPLVVFFYPASGTYGCTREACEFRDAITANDHFKRSGVQVVGVSGDPVAKQKKFVDEHKLGYPILSDANGDARKAYTVPKGFFGLTDGRVTFCIDKDGVVNEVHDSVVNFSMHSKAVDKWLAKIGAAEPTPTATAPPAEPTASATAPAAEANPTPTA